MPYDHPLGGPEDWLRRAHSDLAIARIPQSADILPEDLCFHAQQAAEKALKAVLIANSTPFPRTHNITRLLELIPEDRVIPQRVQEAVILTDYAVASRYPGAYEPVEDKELLEALAMAEAVVTWAEGEVKKPEDDVSTDLSKPVVDSTHQSEPGEAPPGEAPPDESGETPE